MRNPLIPGALIAVVLAFTMAACATDADTGAAHPGGIRAAGMEPGWILTLRPDHWLTLETDNGGHRYVIKTPDATRKGDTRTWHAKSDDLDLTIILQDKTCIAPSGMKQPMTATVTANGETYKGCAHNL